ncbi:hypothetical protein L9F63_018049, partial [Diploptera punctata]
NHEWCKSYIKHLRSQFSSENISILCFLHPVVGQRTSKQGHAPSLFFGANLILNFSNIFWNLL